MVSHRRSRIDLPAFGLLFLLCIIALSAPRGEAAENDFKVVDGVLASPLVLPDDDVAEVAAPDGALYYVDLRLLPREPVRLAAQTPVTIVGYEGERPELIAAHILKLRAAPPPPIPERRAVDLRMIEGKVKAASRQTILLGTSGGTVTVRVDNLVRGASPLLVVGETVKVFGVLAEDDTFAANALVLHAPSRRGATAYQGGDAP